MTAANTRRRPGRPTGGQPVVDRDDLLDAAERAIRRAGPAVSLEVIAREAGVTKPVVYDRIGGRTELAHALAERVVDRILAAVSTAIEGEPSGRSTLSSFIGAHLATVAADRELYVYVTGGTSNESPDRMLYLARRSAAPLTEQLAAWRAGRGRDPAAAKPWAYAIIGMLHLVVLWWITEADRPADELAEQLTDLLWSGLADD